MLNLVKEETDRLTRENELLRNEAKDFKKQLMLAEINNGVRQIPIPTKRSISESNKVNEQKNVKKGNGKEVNEKKVKVDKDTKAPPSSNDSINVSKLDLRVGLIVSAEKHPDADKQYVEEVNVGDEGGAHRTVVSGLVNYVPLEAIQGRLAVFLCNLKPAKIRGVMSEAMLVCACTSDKVELLVPPPGCVPGDQVICPQFPGKPEPQLNPKKKIWETVKPNLKTNNKCVATFKGQVLVVEGKGEVNVPTLADAQLS
ncbi:AIMP1 [Acanthosepion pharaonis]|uniref:AIMP1 n=1 Tax=Acanthosepion pharaonis TaxID=158019 RepID=A0A812EFQ4_ACAPH|nr:AIMP1 [Sepia pharaonis]